MNLYKGFDKDLKCRGFQYEAGKEYEEPTANLCSSGFHACENPIDVFGYYPPNESRYCEVELNGVSDEKSSDDSKRVGKKIKIGAEIGIKGLVDAFIKFTFDMVDWKNAKESNTGYQSAATNTGDQSAATNTGDRSAATNTGDRSAATNTGYQSAATNTGDRSAATVNGKESVAIVTGIEGRASGSLGNWIVVTERDEWNGETYPIKEVKAAKVDGKKIKADTFYMLKGGKFVEV